MRCFKNLNYRKLMLSRYQIVVKSHTNCMRNILKCWHRFYCIGFGVSVSLVWDWWMYQDFAITFVHFSPHHRRTSARQKVCLLSNRPIVVLSHHKTTWGKKSTQLIHSIPCVWGHVELHYDLKAECVQSTQTMGSQFTNKKKRFKRVLTCNKSHHC